MKLLALEGLDSYFAMQAYGKVLLGLKMLPFYELETWDSFYERINELTPPEKEELIRKGLFLGQVTPAEVTDLAKFCADDNGVHYGPQNMKKLGPDTIFEILVMVCLEISKLKVRFVSDEQKKNLRISPLTSKASLSDIQT